MCRGRVHLLCDLGHGELPSWHGGLMGLWGQETVSQSVRCHPVRGVGLGVQLPSTPVWGKQ